MRLFMPKRMTEPRKPIHVNDVDIRKRWLLVALPLVCVLLTYWILGMFSAAKQLPVNKQLSVLHTAVQDAFFTGQNDYPFTGYEIDVILPSYSAGRQVNASKTYTYFLVEFAPVGFIVLIHYDGHYYYLQEMSSPEQNSPFREAGIAKELRFVAPFAGSLHSYYVYEHNGKYRDILTNERIDSSEFGYRSSIAARLHETLPQRAAKPDSGVRLFL